jgi:NADH:ubiquinone oxidoreductase subunit 6 (subunit J)
MTLPTVIFYSLAALLIVLALIVVSTRQLFHAALALAGALSIVGALYAFLGADFLAASQILLYVGGIMVLILFAIMFVQSPDEGRVHQSRPGWFWAILIALGLVGLLIEVFHLAVPPFESQMPWTPTSAALGRLLLNDMLVPFEVVSLILLVALIGAVVFGVERES